MRRALPLLLVVALATLPMLASAQDMQAREARFQKERDAAAAANAAAQRELAKFDAETTALRTQYEANSRAITELEKRLAMSADDTTDIPGTIRQSAIALSQVLNGSVGGTHAPGRDELLKKLVDDKHLPDAGDLEALWKVFEGQLRASATVQRFEATVHSGGGSSETEVIRVGEFAAISDGLWSARYLAWENGKGLVSGRQPPREHRSVAHEFANANSGLQTMVIDPSAGVMLAQLAHQPDMTRFALIALVTLSFFMFGLTPLLRRRWTREGSLHHHAVPMGIWARATATYDRRFWVALSVSAGHLLFLLYLLVGLFGLQFSATVAQAEEVFEIVPLSEGPPGDPGESGGSPAPPAALPPPPTPSLAAISTMPTIPAPNLKVPSPTLNFSATPASSTMFGSQFSGFAGSGSGTGAGAGMGAGGYGTGRGGGGKPLIPLSTARPQITEYAYRRGIEGWVIVQFTVTQSGNVRDIRIVDAQPKGLFEAAAVESISHWIYPRMDRESQVTQKVEFKLEDYKYNWR